MLKGNDPVKTSENAPKNDAEFLKVARERAVRGLDWWKDNFEVAQHDLNFLYGVGQWDSKARKEREDEGRPCLTLNQLPQFKRQVVNAMRMATPAISVIPSSADIATGKQSKIANLAGTKNYSLAEVYEGLIRNIENQSNADRHYDRAGQHAVESGFGWLRVLTEYQNQDTFDQDVKIGSLQNRFSVICDPDYTLPDTTDKNWLIIGERMHKTEFKARYPDAQVGDLADSDRSQYKWWSDGDYIRVAEYFYRVPATVEILLLSDGRVTSREIAEPILDELAQAGITIVNTRKVKTWKVMWRKITAYSVLETETEWPGTIIPVIPVVGEEFSVGDKMIYLGLHHFAKDGQMMSNYWWTAATEKVALSPKAPWVAPAEAVESYEREWENANRGNPSLLRYNQYDENGLKLDAPKRSDFAAMPAAEMQLALAATDLVKSTLGMYDTTLGNKSNETSGVAIDSRKSQSDTGNFHYIDNRDMAIAAIGKILVEIIPRVYDGDRVIRVLGEDRAGDWVQINQTVRDEQSGKDVLLHDLAQGRFDVVVKSGPSFSTQREEAVESMLRFVQAVPETGRILLDLIAENMDWHLSREASRRLKMSLPREMLKPEEIEELELDKNPAQPTPEQQAEMAIQQSKADQAKADVAKSQEQNKGRQIDLALEKERTKQAELEYSKIKEQAMLGKPDFQVVAKMVADAMAEIKLTEMRAVPQR